MRMNRSEFVANREMRAVQTPYVTRYPRRKAQTHWFWRMMGFK